jgi:hypothetical protein
VMTIRDSQAQDSKATPSRRNVTPSTSPVAWPEGQGITPRNNTLHKGEIADKNAAPEDVAVSGPRNTTFVMAPHPPCAALFNAHTHCASNHPSVKPRSGSTQHHHISRSL